MGRGKKIRIALVCNVGFAAKWHPLGIALLKQQLETTTNIHVDNYFLSSEFTYYINRYQSHLAEINCEIEEESTSYANMYFSTRVFRHTTPRVLLKKVILNFYNDRDKFRTRLCIKRRYSKLPQEGLRYFERIMSYCILLEKFLPKYLRHIDWTEYSLIGFSCLSPQLMTSIHTAMRLRIAGYNSIIIFGGGMFTTWNTKQYATIFPDINGFVAGDGYHQIINVLKQSSKCLKIYKNNRQWHFGDFSDMPKKIFHSNNFWLPVQLSGGCYWSRCKFCAAKSEPHRNLYTKRLVDWIVYQKKSNYISRFGFVDPDLNSSIAHFKKLLSVLRKSGRKFSIYGMLNTRNINKQIVKDMKKAGFTHVLLGVENFCNKMLAKINKRADIVDNTKAIKWLVEENIAQIMFNLIIDFPGTDALTIEENRKNIGYIGHILTDNVDVELIEFDLERNSIAYRSRNRLGLNGFQNFVIDGLVYPKKMRIILKFHSVKFRWHRISNGWQDIQRIICFRKNQRILLRDKGKQIAIYHGRKVYRKYKFNDWQGRVNTYICSNAAELHTISKIAGRGTREIKEFMAYMHLQHLVLQSNGRYLGLALSKVH